MNWKHLLWVIPLSIVLGAFVFNFLLSWMFDFTMDYATEQALERLEDCHVAWEEIPLSDKRVIGQEGELCYNMNLSIVCPQRELPLYESLKEVDNIVDVPTSIVSVKNLQDLNEYELQREE